MSSAPRHEGPAAPLLASAAGISSRSADLYRRIIADCRLPPRSSSMPRVATPSTATSWHRCSVRGTRPRCRLRPRRASISPFSSAGVMRCLTDVEQAGLRSSFDVVWMCRSMHSAADPQQRVSALAGLLRPGGRLIVVENDPFHCSIPAWSAEFERRVQHAVERLLQRRCSNGASIDRLGPWPLAGLAGGRQAASDHRAHLPGRRVVRWRTNRAVLAAIDETTPRVVRPFLPGAEWRAYAESLRS